jgi:hypothetical protein
MFIKARAAENYKTGEAQLKLTIITKLVMINVYPDFIYLASS